MFDLEVERNVGFSGVKQKVNAREQKVGDYRRKDLVYALREHIYVYACVWEFGWWG